MANIHVYVREVRASLGLANGLLYTISRLFDKTTGGRCRLLKYYFVAQPVPAPSPTYARVSKTRVYRISPDNSVVRQFPRPSSVIEKRFADGAICFVAEQSGTFVGFLWIKQERYREDEVKCDYWLHPPAEVVWDFDTYVKPAFRMGRAFAQLWEGANQFLRDHGYRWTVSRISAFNAASLASHRRLGIVHLDTGVFFVAGELQLAVVSRPPFLHVSIRPDRVLRLDFHAPATDAK